MEKVTLQDPKLRDGKIDKESLTIIEQLTLLNLDYARTFLAAHEKPRSGPRMEVRQGLKELLGEQPGLKPELRALLDELDLWGNQRIRLRHFPQELLKDFDSLTAVRKMARAAGMFELLDRRVDLQPPETTTPMSISYEERDGSRFLKLVAAKTRVQYIPEPFTEEITFPEHSDIVYKPFKKETQKIVNFAEINLDTGHSIISSPLVRPGYVVTTDFTDFYESFGPFMRLGAGQELTLFKATKNIRYLLQTSDVVIRGRKTRTNIGGTIALTSHAPDADIRKDQQLRKVEKALPKAPSPFCNCYWAPIDGLNEIVHTHVLASQGEVVIMGQARELSVRHVLQRIYSIN
jgi:hypothetical protein